MLSGWPKRGQLAVYVLLAALITAVTMFLLTNSEPYEFAKAFAASDARVLGVTGTQSANRLSPLKGFRYTFGDRTGEADFTFKVTGERGTFNVRVALEKREGQWKVIRSQTTSEAGEVKDIVGTTRS